MDILENTQLLIELCFDKILIFIDINSDMLEETEQFKLMISQLQLLISAYGSKFLNAMALLIYEKDQGSNFDIKNLNQIIPHELFNPKVLLSVRVHS